MSIVGGPGADQGAETLLALARILSDPTQLEAKHKEFVAAKADAQKVIDLVAPAQEILKIRGEIAADREAARKALSEAQMKASEVMGDAQRRADEFVSQAEARVAATEEKAAAIHKSASEKLAEAEAALAQARATEASARRTLDEALKAKKAHEAAKQEADGERLKLSALKARLKDAASAIAKSLVDH